jgi:hypothetical protein
MGLMKCEVKGRRETTGKKVDDDFSEEKESSGRVSDRE